MNDFDCPVFKVVRDVNSPGWCMALADIELHDVIDIAVVFTRAVQIDDPDLREPDGLRQPPRDAVGIPRRFENTNRCPARAFSSITLVTSPCKPSKLRRISHGTVHKYTRTLAGRLITVLPATPRIPPANSLHPPECAALRRPPA